MRRGIFKTLAVLLLVTAFFAGLVVLGRWALAKLRSQDRYSIPFREIECSSPPAQSRGEFLDEVQYLARLPDQLRLLEDGLTQQLATAFAQHPWVESVEEVTIKPPRHVAVRLRLRTPVLAVAIGDTVRAVDGWGILLPKNAVTDHLPVYQGNMIPPAGPAGTRWGDPAVEKAAAERRGK